MNKYFLFSAMAFAILIFGCKKNTNDTNVAVTGVTLNKTTLSLVTGTTETLTATIAPENATNKNVSWSSSSDAIATVDNTGKVTAVAAGTATITVTTADGNKTATCTVTVTATSVSVTGVSLNKTTLSLVTGTTETLTATIAPANATNKNVSWSSSSDAIATVDNTGKVTAVAAGTATITVTTADGNKTATCTVTVTRSDVSVPIGVSNWTFTTPVDFWYSSDTKLSYGDGGNMTTAPPPVTLTQNLTGIAAGNYKVSISYGIKHGTFTINGNPYNALALDYTWTEGTSSGTTITVNNTGNITMTLIIAPSDYSSVEIYSITLIPVD